MMYQGYAKNLESRSIAPMGLGNMDYEQYASDEVLHAKGRVRILYEDFDSKGNSLGIRQHWDDHNLVVDLGRSILANLFYGNGNSFAANYIGLGTGGHESGEGGILHPIDPLVTDTDLYELAFQKPLTTKEMLDNTTLRFTIFLDKGEGNGPSGVIAYTEAGLFTANAKLFARETFAALVKTNTRAITFIWDVLF